ncbi:MAG: 30S ribosomal protein S21 [Nitrospirota bacterium]
MEIKVIDNDVEKAIKVLKRKVQTEGLLKEIKARSYYEKPSVKEKRKRAEARKKRAKAQKFRRF